MSVALPCSLPSPDASACPPSRVSAWSDQPLPALPPGRASRLAAVDNVRSIEFLDRPGPAGSGTRGAQFPARAGSEPSMR
jgi:hypothetical protein